MASRFLHGPSSVISTDIDALSARGWQKVSLGPDGVKARCRKELNRTSMEREKGFEPSTSTLARLRSASELLPLALRRSGRVLFLLEGGSQDRPARRARRPQGRRAPWANRVPGPVRPGQAAGAAAAGAGTPAPAPAGQRRALVVDDAPLVGRLLVSMLRRLGWSADQLTDSHEALERARSGNYAVVLADHGLPGMTGVELAAALQRELAAPPPVILVTGRPLGPEELAAPGVLGLLRKPFQLADLAQVLDRLPAQR
ncbi:MAG: hypothetical protein KatS3mg102_2054 [Planctomycetota bacterium]|nr:MAG: hypothetical protein KatS3mg102_2054 [Planctomycetota bacterium]